MEFIAHNLEETEAFAKNFAASLKKGDCVTLHGDLGAGKTTFVKAVCKVLGFDGVVTSPTFTLVNQYEGKVTIYHFDLYRLDGSEEAIAAGLDEILKFSEGISFVEWPENATSIIPVNAIKVKIEVLSANERKFTVEE